MTDDAVERIVTAIAKYEAEKIGLPANQKSLAFFSGLVDRAKIQPMCQFLRDSPSRNPDQVVARFVAFFDDSSWLIDEDADSAPLPVSVPDIASSVQDVHQAPVSESLSPSIQPASPPVSAISEPALVSAVSQTESKDLEPESLSSEPVARVFDMSEQKGPLPVTLDNHTQLVIGTGIFRTLNKNLINNPTLRPMLDSKIIYEVDPRFMNGYKAMTLAGPVLDSDFDIKTYLCLVKLLGSMTDAQYERAAASNIEITPEQFYSPLAEFLSPAEFGSYISDFMRTDKILHSMKRLHAFQMTLFKRPEDAEGHRGKESKESSRMKGSVMIVGLVSVIGLDGDGIIRITPNLPMREMYRAASRLIAVNRSTIIGFQHPISRIFSLWLTTIGNGQFKKDWVYINKKLSVREILEGIHPLTEGGYYKKRHVKMLEVALVELVGSGVLECAYRRHTETQFAAITPENCKVFSLDGLKVEVELIRHRISHKQSPHDTPRDGRGELEIEELVFDTPIEVPALTLSIEIMHILKSLNFKRARNLNMSETVALYQADLANVAARIKLLHKADPALCRKAMKSVLGYKRERLAKLFEAGLNEPEKTFMAEVCTEFWGPITSTSSNTENRLYNLLSMMPRESQIKDPDKWAITYEAQVQDFLALMVTEEGEAMLKGVRAAMLNSRLINPLTKAGLSKEAKLVKFRAEAVK
ncbi:MULTISPECIES: hypothetical protein [Aeromonas]|uniref:hypothetical protein n=1 Tax=Aeromonas TaxID=642 RepID=UPI000AF5BB0A|nr:MULTISPECIES: hypothetical protein [Aeromonas]